MKNFGTILIADSHLTEGSGGEKAFFEMLSSIGESDFDVVFMGDVFELWIAFPSYETILHRRFLDWCRAESKKRKIGFLEGNHEYYVKQEYASAFTWVSDGFCFLGNTALFHGDAMNPDDHPFLLLRTLLRNPVSRQLVRLFGPLCGKPLSDWIRRSLKTSNMQHKKHFPESAADRMIAFLEKQKKTLSLCVAGHFHAEHVRGKLHTLPAWTPDEQKVGFLAPDGTLSVTSFRQIKTEK